MLKTIKKFIINNMLERCPVPVPLQAFISIGLLCLLIIALHKPFFAYMISEREKVIVKTKIKEINLFMPASFDSLITLSEKPESGINQEMFRYFELLAQVYNHSADTHSLFGFCLFHRGKNDKAIASYKKAAELNPHFFWTHYNLGILYFKKEQFNDAVVAFQKALATRPKHTLQTIFHSKVYRQIIQKTKNNSNDVEARLTTGYLNSRKLLMLSYYYLGLKLKSLGQDGATGILQQINPPSPEQTKLITKNLGLYIF
ncbi:MAG: tetratricopeptide repeat protein [Candidatus Omnitrophica bacterium]|nr:tetratricopeptide repeat protein [Candidatus Omnitrophota bacterium]